MQIAHIRQQFMMQRQSGKARHREIAGTLEISEGALIAAHAGTPQEGMLLRATRLQPQWPAILSPLSSLGEVMALTRNAACVHEKTGIYPSLGGTGADMAQAPGMGLHMSYAQWVHGLAVTESVETGVQQSLQFFDAEGTAMHKVFMRPQSDVQAYYALVATLADADQQPGMAIRQAQVTAPAVAPKSDVAGFQSGRVDVLPARLDVASRLLEYAARAEIAITVTVGNPGMLQTHTGIVSKVAVMGPWLNVLDPGFNLHLREDLIASAWFVRKPAAQGLVNSLELLDHGGQLIAMFAAAPGMLSGWDKMMEALCSEGEACAS